VVSSLLEKCYRATCTSVNTSTVFKGVINVAKDEARQLLATALRKKGQQNKEASGS